MKRNYASSLARWGRFAAAALGVALLPAYLAAAEYVRVFEGPDPDAIYLRLFAGDPSIVEVGGRGEAGEAGAVAVRMPGFSSNRSAGDPILPYGRYRLALPPDADPASLSLEVVNVV